MNEQTYQYDQRVLVDFFGDGEEKAGEIDAIDFEGDPEFPYRVWYGTPRIEPSWGNNPPIEVECEWVRPSMLRPERERQANNVPGASQSDR